MARSKVEMCLKKKTLPEHKFSVTFVSKVGTKIIKFVRLFKLFYAVPRDYIQIRYSLSSNNTHLLYNLSTFFFQTLTEFLQTISRLYADLKQFLY